MWTSLSLRRLLRKWNQFARKTGRYRPNWKKIIRLHVQNVHCSALDWKISRSFYRKTCTTRVLLLKHWQCVHAFIACQAVYLIERWRNDVHAIIVKTPGSRRSYYYVAVDSMHGFSGLPAVAIRLNVQRVVGVVQHVAQYCAAVTRAFGKSIRHQDANRMTDLVWFD